MNHPTPDSTDGPAVRLVRAARTYRARADQPDRGLHATDLDLPAARVIALVGGNGAGKSTLLNMIATLSLPTSGTIHVLGHTVGPAATPAQLRGLRARIAVATARPMLDPLLTARENLRLAAALRGLGNGKDTAAHAEALAHDLGFADRLADRVGRLSTGLARRVDLARTLLGHADLIVLDEPAGPLDEPGRRALHGELRRRVDEGATVILATHDVDELRFADHVVALHAGRVAVASPSPQLADMLALTVVRWRWRDVPSDAVATVRALSTAGDPLHAGGDEGIAGAATEAVLDAITAELRRRRVPHAVGPIAAADIARLAPQGVARQGPAPEPAS